MSDGNLFFACGMAGILLSLLLYVLFGQITVRKLRKNSVTREKLGIEFASGWDILNVAQALAWPKMITAKLKNSRIAFLYADAELLVEHTNKLDKVLAVTLYWLLISSVLVLFVSGMLNG